ncbi:MAG TPA: MBL fold metallo-hydrolase [Dokdonella sp.]|nr:MBL fold metallo-hydrolase [Dokdonella sp.]
MKSFVFATSSLFATAVIGACGSGPTAANAPPSSLFHAAWNSGQRAGEPAFQAQEIDENTIAIRQSLGTSFEAPFLYLLFGTERALLIDTGVEGVDLRTEVDGILSEWAATHGKAVPELVVMHSHGHSDHKGGDAQLADRPGTTIVGLEADDIAAFFNIRDWPNGIGSIDLGARSLQIVPTPGHADTHVMVFDQTTRILFSGDAIYPGRLYYQCGKAATYEATINRIASYVVENKVKWLLGGHIEMSTTPAQAFPQDERVRHGEHLLELPASIVGKIQIALKNQAGQPRVQPFDEFWLLPHPANPAGKSPPDWCLASKS